MDEGWTRYIFDTFNVPYSSVRDADIRQGALNSKFDALILSVAGEHTDHQRQCRGNVAGGVHRRHH